MLMSLFTYFVFGDEFVKFGILHFIAFASFVLFYFVDDLKIIYTLLVLSDIMLLFNKNISFTYFQKFQKKIAFVSGFFNVKYRSIDHFPIFPWIIVVLVGVLIDTILKKINQNYLKL